jgi:SAM-dependent methyltransferase
MKAMACRICEKSDVKELWSWPEFPLYIWPIDQDYAQEYARLCVYWCPECGLVQLDRFEESFIQKLYSKDVFGLVSASEFPSTSAKNNDFLRYCVRTLGANWAVGRRLLDVGGYDLLTSVDLNYSAGVICDPNAPEAVSQDNLTTRRDFFSRRCFERNEFDVVIAKHVVEHIEHVRAFVEDVHYVLKDRGRFILEVPELKSSTGREACAVFYHQHVMYFDRFSLGNLLRKSGFNIVDIEQDGTNLRMIAEKAAAGSAFSGYEIDRDIPEAMGRYRLGLQVYFEELRRFLEKNAADRIICYGAGGGTTILLHLCPFIRESIEFVVDSSRNKIDKKIGGADFVIRPPEALRSLSCRDILINSDIFFDEIADGIRQHFGKNDFNILRIHPHFERLSLSGAGARV